MSAAPIPPANGKRKLAHEMNVVPYIDVMLVLLIIFMVTAPLMTPGVEIDLPDVGGQNLSTQDEEPVTLYVSASGEFFLDIGEGRDQALGEDEVVSRVAAVLRNAPERMILVRADARVPYASVAAGSVLLQEAGARRVGFVTDPRPEPR